MQRNVVMPIVGGVLAAAVLVAAILIIGHRHKSTELTITSPAASFTPLPTESPSASPSASPTATATTAASASPDATPKATASHAPTPTPHPVRAVSSVNCKSSSDVKYCSNVDGTIINNKQDTTPPANPGPKTYPDSATISMQSSMQSGNKLHVVVTVENKTKKTFHFAQREIQWDIVRDGAHLETLSTHGAGFDMAPGGKMTGTFDRYLDKDGTYNWQAKTWYYVK